MVHTYCWSKFRKIDYIWTITDEGVTKHSLMTTNFVEHYIISGITEQVTKLNSFAPFTLNMNTGFL